MGFMTLVPRSNLFLHWLFSHRVELASEKGKQNTRKQMKHLISIYWYGERAFSRIQPERGSKEEEHCVILTLTLPLRFHLPLISLQSRCPVHPLRIVHEALWGDQLKGWAVWDRWADDGSDVIDSRVMDGRLADRGLMQCWGCRCTEDGLAIDR